jgi:hypothetical protein
MVRSRLTRSREPTSFYSQASYLVIGICVGFYLASLRDANRFSWTLTPNNNLSLPSPDVSAQTNDGWKQIHVFVGNQVSSRQLAGASTISNSYFEKVQWFSQVRQDLVVFKLLREKRNGYFVDLAANDAVKISNTYALEQFHGWTGLAIEPNPIYWSSLSFRKCHVAAAVIGQRTGEELLFRFPRDKAPKGGLVGEQYDNKKSNRNNNSNEEQWRFAVSLRDVFEKFQVPSVIDYFSLDVEGAETFVMESFPFDQYRFDVLTVERADDKLRNILEQNGYKRLKNLRSWGETLWIHSSIENLIDKSALTIDTEHYQYREK